MHTAVIFELFRRVGYASGCCPLKWLMGKYANADERFWYIGRIYVKIKVVGWWLDISKSQSIAERGDVQRISFMYTYKSTWAKELIGTIFDNIVKYS